MLRRLMALLCLAIGVSACTESEDSSGNGEGSSEHALEVEIGVFVSACQFDGEPLDGACLQLRLPNAEVEVISAGETIWAGKTDEAGEVLAQFTPPDEWFATVSSPWLTEDLTSPVRERDATITGFDLSTRDYNLDPIPLAEE